MLYLSNCEPLRVFGSCEGFGVVCGCVRVFWVVCVCSGVRYNITQICNIVRY